ncbi:TPT-domain-containing protein [Pluteus cervinus]|uniref:TPT-domain-containing protein n=1 Tax=Pluteus cervinus TaxID=181527 RepID=A0ACD3BAM7_9AGAR|nr:TPT-domain-containing protein [Pluteus cervinus]
MSTSTASNVRFVFLCALWYSSSALSSNTGKAILTQFRYPVTLTFIQFAFIAVYCLLFMSPMIKFSNLRHPTWAIVRTTLPMGLFQVGGHMFSSIAISRIPVSTVHTIKALSPLFTVAAYALLFGVSYSAQTYISLLPLTIGVMLACSFDVSASNALGLLCAFGSAIIFVSSNIFFKKVMPSNSPNTSHKLDKLNLLLYSSGMAFLLMLPLWLYYDLPAFISGNTNHITYPQHEHAAPHSTAYYIFMNGTVHFAQNIIAFIILSSTSPVTYSIASLIKRVAVICIAIVWFNQSVHPVQGFGITMTFAGLYMYNNAKSDVEHGEKKMRRVEAARDLQLPTTKSEAELPIDGSSTNIGVSTTGTESVGYGRPRSLSVTNGRRQYPMHRYHDHMHPSESKIGPMLSIKTTPLADFQTGPPRLGLYPSPPPSLDSPPHQSIPLGQAYISVQA